MMPHIDDIADRRRDALDAQYQRGIDAEAAHADALDGYIDRAIDEALADDDENEALLVVLESDGVREPMESLLLNFSAYHLQDWLRLLMCAPVADLDIVAVNMRDWMRERMAADAVTIAAAEAMMAQDLADGAEMDTQDQAEAQAEWVRL